MDDLITITVDYDIYGVSNIVEAVLSHGGQVQPGVTSTLLLLPNTFKVGETIVEGIDYFAIMFPDRRILRHNIHYEWGLFEGEELVREYTFFPHSFALVSHGPGTMRLLWLVGETLRELIITPTTSNLTVFTHLHAGLTWVSKEFFLAECEKRGAAVFECDTCGLVYSMEDQSVNSGVVGRCKSCSRAVGAHED